MATVEEDPAREARFQNEILVDAYGPEEQALGWYYYLEGALPFPFTAGCLRELRISPLKTGEQVRVIGMLPEEDCAYEMYVEIEWCGRTLGVPLAQLAPVDAGPAAEQASADWHYWLARGYQF